mgnify:CR=1 FL=1
MGSEMCIRDSYNGKDKANDGRGREGPAEPTVARHPARGAALYVFVCKADLPARR